MNLTYGVKRVRGEGSEGRGREGSEKKVREKGVKGREGRK